MDSWDSLSHLPHASVDGVTLAVVLVQGVIMAPGVVDEGEYMWLLPGALI